MNYTRLEHAQRATTITLGLNIALALVKAAVGLVGGSRALVADAVHSASDGLATVIVRFGVKIADAPPDDRHQYGHQKLESVASKVVALILMGTGALIGWDAIRTIASGIAAVPQPLTAWFAAGSVVIKEVMYRYTTGVARRIRSPALAAEAWHHRSDALSSIAAVIGIIGARLGWPLLDPAAGLVVAALILRMGGELYWRSVEELVDTAPPPETMDHLERTAKETPGVIQVNSLKARIHGPDIIVDVKICVYGGMTVDEGHDIARRVRLNLEATDPRVFDVLVHVNPCQRRPGEDPDYCSHCRPHARSKPGQIPS